MSIPHPALPEKPERTKNFVAPTDDADDRGMRAYFRAMAAEGMAREANDTMTFILGRQSEMRRAQAGAI